MDEARPLRDVFDRLVAQEHDAAGGLVGSGHDDLDATMLADALVGYSDTVPVEVAEHLEHFVTAVTTHQAPDPTIGLDLLTTAPAVADDALAEPGPPDDLAPADPGADPEPADDLGFGTGTTEVVLPDATTEPVPGDTGAVGSDVLAAEPAFPSDEDPDAEDWLDLTALDEPEEPEAGPDETAPGE